MLKTISYRLSDLDKVLMPIGFMGENLYKRIIIDCSEVYNVAPNAVVSMAVSPPRGDNYPGIVTRDGNNVIWDVTASDLLYDGKGAIQLTFTDSPTICKSFKAKFTVNNSITPSGTTPTPIANWLVQAGEALTACEEATQAALNAADKQPTIVNDYWYVWDDEEEQYVTTGVKAKGDKGDPGDPGSPGDPTLLIDDTTPAANKTFSSTKVDNELTQVKRALTSISDNLIFQDSPANLYEPQGIADIMDGYILKNGTPQTKYGSGYYVSDYVPVVGNKTITFSYAPWATGQSQPDAEWRAAEYDSSKNFIRIISTTTHTLSANAAFVRFSVARQNTTTAERIAYVNANLSITDGESGAASPYIDMEDNTFMEETTVRKTDAFFVDASQSEILIMWKMPGANNKDVGVKMKTFTNNSGFSFSSFGTAPNKTQFVGSKPANYTEYMSTSEDHFSPFGVYAVNNADGDYQGVSKYTGGFHRLDGIDTARLISLDMYFDGRKISNFVGYCRTIDIYEVHNIQGANTFKANGEGREIIQETIHIHFENGQIDVETTVKALEDVTIKVWYFIQGHHKPDGLGSAGIRYIGGDSSRGIVSMDEGSNSGDKNARVMRFLSTVLQMEMEMDSFDIGRFQYNEGSYSCDVRAYTGYSKGYFEAIAASNSPFALDEGDTCVARGHYRFGMFE